MGLSLSQLAGATKTLELRYPDEETGEAFTVTYRPGAITERKLDEVRAEATAADGSQGDKALNAMLATVLVSWEVLDDAGEPIPPTRENLADLPVPFLSFVLLKLQEAGSPAAEGKA